MTKTKAIVAAGALVLGLALTFSSQLSVLAQVVSTTVQKVVTTDASGNVITPSTDATTNTTTQTTGPQFFCNASTATPTAVGADGRSIAVWCDTNGQLRVATHAVTVASGGIASGAVASGAIASGAIASGAFASGSIGSGAIASGAIASGAVASGAFGSDSASFGVSATGAAPPAKANYIGGLASGATGGFLTGVPVCDSFKAVSMTSATTTLMVTGVSGRHVRICSIHLVTAIANNVALIGGTGATCGTGTSGLAGGTTAANGWNFAANGGLALGSGLGTVIQTAATGDSVCIITSAAGPLAGTIAYAIY